MRTVSFSDLTGRVTGYLQEERDAAVAHKVRPALVICPGGAYRYCSLREQDPPALAFLAQGYQVFLLEYSVETQAGAYRPLRELAETLTRIRKNSAAWHIDPAKVAVMGFSAGGHLAASLGALWNDRELCLPTDARPDALLLCYPVLSAYEYAHDESIRWVTGGREELRRKLDIPSQVTADFPPTFLWHGGADDSVPPENSLLLSFALRRAGVPVELHLFSEGGHGLATCTQETDSPCDACRPWLALAEDWLNRRFSFVP